MSNNINGGGRSRNAMSSVDFYRRVPKDLTEVRFLLVVLTRIAFAQQCIAWLLVPLRSRLYVRRFWYKFYVGGHLAGSCVHFLEGTYPQKILTRSSSFLCISSFSPAYYIALYKYLY